MLSTIKIANAAGALKTQWAYIQNNRPFAVDLQKEILPFEQVADMSLAREALGLLSRNP